MKDLLPCPFCGGEAECDETYPDSDHDNTHHVSCLFDGCAGNIYQPNETTWGREEAITAWNTRAPQWQPMETAPKDGRKILLLIDEGRDIIQGYWNIAAECWKAKNQTGFAYRIHFPGHWQPSPQPPEDKP